MQDTFAHFSICLQSLPFFAQKPLFAKKAAGGETESVLPPAAERRAMERSQERSGAEWNFAKEFYAMVATATGEASPLM